MPIDSSIYSNVQAPQINIPNPMTMAEQGMRLSQLGMQQAQMKIQLQQQQAVRQAYWDNTDSSGNVDQNGVLSSLGKSNPMAAQSLSTEFAQNTKAKAEAQAAQSDAVSKTLNITGPTYEYLNTVPQDQRSAVWPKMVQDMKDQGVDTSRMDPNFDEDTFQQHLATWRNSKEALANQATQATTAKTQAEAGAIPTTTAMDQAKTQEALANAAKTRSETPTGMSGPITADTDPSTLVPQMMPKDMRPKALEEIKNAQDLSALSPKIMAAFEMGTSKNPITAAQGQKQFAGLMNTTVKETEGTVRQAAMDSIQKNMAPSGITALPGENDTKRQTVLSYLQSKQSAPVSKSYGIDLTKFASTAPYQPPQKTAGDPGGANTAQAAAAPDYQGAINYLKTADPSSPQAFKVRAILKAKGLMQ